MYGRNIRFAEFMAEPTGVLLWRAEVWERGRWRRLPTPPGAGARVLSGPLWRGPDRPPASACGSSTRPEGLVAGPRGRQGSPRRAPCLESAPGTAGAGGRTGGDPARHAWST